MDKKYIDLKVYIKIKLIINSFNNFSNKAKKKSKHHSLNHIKYSFSQIQKFKKQ